MTWSGGAERFAGLGVRRTKAYGLPGSRGTLNRCDCWRAGSRAWREEREPEGTGAEAVAVDARGAFRGFPLAYLQ